MEIIAAPAEKNTKNSAAFGQFQFQQNKKSSQNSLRRQYSANNYSQEQVTQSADSKVLKKSHSSDEESETNSIDDGGSLGIKSDFDETELEGKDAVVPLLQTASDSVLERPTTPNSVAEKVSKGSAGDLLTSWIVNPSETEIRQALSANKTKGLVPKQKARSGLIGQVDQL